MNWNLHSLKSSEPHALCNKYLFFPHTHKHISLYFVNTIYKSKMNSFYIHKYYITGENESLHYLPSRYFPIQNSCQCHGFLGLLVLPKPPLIIHPAADYWVQTLILLPISYMLLKASYLHCGCLLLCRMSEILFLILLDCYRNQNN